MGSKQAVALSGASESTLFRLAAEGRPHSHEEPDGRLLFCVESLRELFDLKEEL